MYGLTPYCDLFDKVRERVAKTLRMEEVTIPLKAVSIVRSYAEHGMEGQPGIHALRLRIYLIPEKVQREEANDFAYGNGLNMALKSALEVRGEKSAVVVRIGTPYVKSDDDLSAQARETPMMIKNVLFFCSYSFVNNCICKPHCVIQEDGIDWNNCVSLSNSFVGLNREYGKLSISYVP